MYQPCGMEKKKRLCGFNNSTLPENEIAIQISLHEAVFIRKDHDLYNYPKYFLHH